MCTKQTQIRCPFIHGHLQYVDMHIIMIVDIQYYNGGQTSRVANYSA